MAINPGKDIRETFHHLVKEHGDMIYNTALGMVQHKEDAEDITQEVFLKVFAGMDRFRQEAQFKTWIYRITINASLDHLRKKKNVTGEFETIEEFNHPGVLAEQKENAALLFRAISTLAEQQKAAFILQKTEGRSVSEVAEILGISVQAAESLLARAKQNLKKKLAGYYEQF